MPKRQLFEIAQQDPEKVQKLSEGLKISPIVARILVNRGICDVKEASDFLFGTIDDLSDPFRMSDMEKAVEIILEHLDRNSKILIHGDYDADGVTSTAIMIKALSRIGADVEFYIPDRFDEGYGFSEEAVDRAKADGMKLIVTVDCGSSDFENVKKAKDLELDVVITDHHEVPLKPPPADAFLNPKKPGGTYPFRELSGAGVAFTLIRGIYKKLEREDWRDFLDLATIGTVADVVPLLGENRLIVKSGIELLNQRKRPGIQHLLEIAGVKRENLSPWDISFIIAPKINAAGRLDDATIALKCLLEKENDRARELAEKLTRMNEERQAVENGIKQEIEMIINQQPELLSQPVWVLSSKGWHQGVIGIVASRFSQSFKRPVFLISIDEEGVGRGSARSIESYNVYNALKSAGDLLMHFGGHPLAGGFTIPEENISKFRLQVSNCDLFTRVHKPLIVDAELPPERVNLDLAKDLEILSPFGEGNPKPLFLTRRVKLQSVAPVGSSDRHLKIWASMGKRDVKGIAFGMGNLASDIFNDDFYYDLIYNLDVDFWNNVEEPSLKVQEIIDPDYESVRIMTGLDQVNLKKPDETVEGCWKLVDARRVINRRKYIRNLSLVSSSSLVFTRNKKQMEVLIHNLEQEGVRCANLLKDKIDRSAGAKVFVSPYDHLDEKCENCRFEEIVLYHPPYLWDHFQLLPFKSDFLKRVHILFNLSDVQREEANQEMLAPDREKLLKIYSYLKKIAIGGSETLIKPGKVARKFKDVTIRKFTILVALKIFSEINLLTYRNNDRGVFYRLNSPKKQDLENSPTFRNQMKKKEIFAQLKQYYTRISLHELERVICNIINESKKEDQPEYGYSSS